MKFQRLWPEILGASDRASFPNKNIVIITNTLTKHSSGLNKEYICKCVYFFL